MARCRDVAARPPVRTRVGAHRRAPAHCEMRMHNRLPPYTPLVKNA